MKTGAKGGVLNILSPGRHAAHPRRGPGAPARPRHPKRIGPLPGHLRSAAARRSIGTTRADPGVPRAWWTAALRTVPASFVLHGRRDPKHGPADRAGTGSTTAWAAPPSRCSGTTTCGGRVSPPRQTWSRTRGSGHALPNIDFVQTLCMSGDMPTDQIFFHDFDAIFRNTTKPTVINILERPFTQLLLEMAAAASGGEERAARAAQRAGHRHAGLAAQDRGDERGHHRRGAGRRADPLLARPDDGRDRPGDGGRHRWR